jgi:NADPH-dependent 2,4-dienoyl-CoA reductase/sulfur reductase-like enzyme
MKVVIIGGIAAGPKAASKVMRMRPDSETTILEKGSFLSYAGCGFPYYVSGEVKQQRNFMETPAGAVRDAAFFLNVKNVKVQSGTEAMEIDLPSKRVRARVLATGDEF